jgi:endonuclease G
MNKILSILIIPIFVFASDCKHFYFNREEPIIQEKHIELCYSEFVVRYDNNKILPIFSAETLNGEEGKIIRKGNFHYETKLGSSKKSTNADFIGTKYDKGHLTPSEDVKTNRGMHDSFVLTNVIPQPYSHNRGVWKKIENITRKYAYNTKHKIYVITGTIIDNSSVSIGVNRIPVPSYLYKIVMDSKLNTGVVFISKNDFKTRDYKLISIRELEDNTKINYFPSLSPNNKERVLDILGSELK